METIEWKTEKRKITELKNWEDNPRTITEEEYKKLEESVKKLGNFQPLVANIDGTVLSGNQRLRLAVANGDIDIEVSIPNRKLSTKEASEVGIVANTHSGQWDMDKLANNFEDILKDLDIDLGITTLKGLGENFELKDGDKAPFQQITFTLSDEQATEIQEAVKRIKQTDEYKYCETFGNENTNGNALYLIISQWGQKI